MDLENLRDERIDDRCQVAMPGALYMSGWFDYWPRSLPPFFPAPLPTQPSPERVPFLFAAGGPVSRVGLGKKEGTRAKDRFL